MRGVVDGVVQADNIVYQKYHTEALVLRSHERGEADRVFALLTHDFGLVRARASAVRRENSRMRYALQIGSRARVSLIRGSRGWRIAGAEAGAGIAPENTGALAVFARLSALLERLVQGEEKNEYLFTSCTEAHAALCSRPREEHHLIELIAVARALYALGYLSEDALGSVRTGVAFEEASLRTLSESKSALLSSVNKALQATQL